MCIYILLSSYTNVTIVYFTTTDWSTVLPHDPAPTDAGKEAEQPEPDNGSEGPDDSAAPGLDEGEPATTGPPRLDDAELRQLASASPNDLIEDSVVPVSRPQRTTAVRTNQRIAQSVADARTPNHAWGLAALIETHPRLPGSNLALLALAGATRPAFAYLASAEHTALPQPDLSAKDCRIPKGYRQACQDPRSDYWIEAINKEWTGIMANDTLEFVPRRSMPPGANLMRSHYVFDLKVRPDNSIEKYKARLVADGCTQKFGIDYDAVFATVVKMATIRVMLAIAAIKDYGLWQLDIQQAFLQAELGPDSNLYMCMPPNLSRFNEKGEELVCKLKKSIYGLKQGAREWANRLLTELVAFGFRQSLIDSCLYIYQQGHDELYVLSWVDDLIILYSSKDILDRFIAAMGKKLPLDDKGELEWVLRMVISRDRKTKRLWVSQTHYIDKLLDKYSGWGNLTKTFESPMDDAKDLTPDDSPVFGSEEYQAMADKRGVYMSVVGSLLWLSACTRPDLTYTTSVLARYVSNPGPAHYKAMLRVLAYLHHTRERILTFAPVQEPALTIYSDASWLARFSVSGGIVYYLNCPVTWWSRRQRSVSHSSAEAEYFAASTASREGMYIRDLLEDLGMGVKTATPLLLDSKAAINLAADPVAFKKTKHILRAAHELRDRVANGLYIAQYVEAANQLADIMTKPLRVHLHRSMLNRILPIEGGQ